MRFALLLFDHEDYWATVPQAEMEAAVAEHAAFGRYLSERGAPFAAAALKPQSEARTLRSGGSAADGPFTPLREDLAGIYLVECADPDEAEELARRCPMGAGIEIRPLWEA
ncbi:YciI family protein [Nonomuraea typhae]|uniref:YciI family protein n=1 Tax=Nonomuraea typhae TaxID=2603600 RepID=UPI0012F9AE1A|nr:YciI family protein [Nonomuraea typhae]